MKTKVKPTSFDFFKNKRVLVTGHTGFKGSWLCQWLLLLGADLYGISDEIPTDPSLFETLGLQNEMSHFLLDINKAESLNCLIQEIQPDIVFHLAAQPIVSTSYADPLFTLQTNVMGTANVLDGLRLLDKKCVGIFITSDKCYENKEWEWGYKETDVLGGKDIYSGSKAAAELIFQCYFTSFFIDKPNIRIGTGRAGNVIGGGDWAKDRILPDCVRSWKENKEVELRNPYATRPWQHVLEPLSGYLQMAHELWESDRFNGESFNFGPPMENNISVLNLLERLAKHFHFDDPKSAYRYNEDSPFSEAGLLMLNCEKANFHLKWNPVLDLDQLIDFTGDWYRKYIEDEKRLKSFTIQQIELFVNIAREKNIKWAKSKKKKDALVI